MIGTICQPIIDFVYAVDDSLLMKLNGNGRTNGYLELKDDILAPMVKNRNFKKRSGGTSLNTMNLLARKSDIPLKVIGAVGNDENGKYLESVLAENNIDYSLEVVKGQKTARCNVFLSNMQDRFLLTNLGAATCLSDAYIDKHKACLLKSKIVYFSMFIVLKQKKIQKLIAEEIKDQILVINLSDANIIKTNKKVTTLCFEKADYIVGNRDEVASLYSIIFEGMGGEFTPESFLTFKSKKIIVTNGNQPTYYLSDEIMETSECSQFHNLTIDTNGAGDSFAAGLVYGIYHNFSLKESIMTGHEWAHEHIIKNSKNIAELIGVDDDDISY